MLESRKGGKPLSPKNKSPLLKGHDSEGVMLYWRAVFDSIEECRKRRPHEIFQVELLKCFEIFRQPKRAIHAQFFFENLTRASRSVSSVEKVRNRSSVNVAIRSALSETWTTVACIRMPLGSNDAECFV